MYRVGYARTLLNRRLKKWLQKTEVRGISGGLLDQQGGQASPDERHGTPAHILEKS